VPFFGTFSPVPAPKMPDLVDSYWPFLPDRIAPGTIPNSFFNLLALRIENRKKLLFAQLGFPAVRQCINQLQTITGQPVSTSLPYEAWSFRTALRILGISLDGTGVFRSTPRFSACDSAVLRWIPVSNERWR